jgi:molybdenum cofactor sulfurtransferase
LAHGNVFSLISGTLFLCVVQLILSSNDAARGSLNIKVENFRPNLVVTGGTGQPHQEDAWKTLRLHVRTDKGAVAKEGEKAGAMEARAMELQVTGPCSRCSMVNVDGTSGSMDCRAFQALSTYRKDGSSVYFGQFCSLVSSVGGSERFSDSILYVGAVVHVS